MTPLEMSLKLWHDRVEHLERVVAGSQQADDTILDAACPLCKVYKCPDCPVAKHLKVLACEGAPVWSYDFCVYKQDWPIALEYARQMERMLLSCKEC